jgi:hypothetical protein
MKSRALLVLALLVIAPLALPATAVAEEVKRAPAGSPETKAEVPELFDFHEVIVPIWHEAWPNKDTAALIKALPDVESGAAKITKAKLPGILRDRQKAWDEQVKKLNAIVADYRAAAEKKETQPLLDAAEKLHSQFEAMIRTIRPALPEIDSFHQTLYQLYHYDLPAWNLPKIQTDAKELVVKVEALGKAQLGKRHEAKKAGFEAKRKELDAAVRELAKLAEAGTDQPAIKAAIEKMHSSYQALEGIF